MVRAPQLCRGYLKWEVEGEALNVRESEGGVLSLALRFGYLEVEALWKGRI